ncbi:hypothetical protein [Xenophilus sp. Marseille-Q4582]|uniref:hypothetical protein n=1 Tax=Xenophilus sp. Marseille-Q4582 TaxID=2866600 RepID=UPI001CE45393|nr:hypothetical protein [Xenophilus sp. Marseille-Q4582]
MLNQMSAASEIDKLIALSKRTPSCLVARTSESHAVFVLANKDDALRTRRAMNGGGWSVTVQKGLRTERYYLKVTLRFPLEQ